MSDIHVADVRSADFRVADVRSENFLKPAGQLSLTGGEEESCLATGTEELQPQQSQLEQSCGGAVLGKASGDLSCPRQD